MLQVSISLVRNQNKTKFNNHGQLQMALTNRFLLWFFGIGTARDIRGSFRNIGLGRSWKLKRHQSETQTFLFCICHYFAQKNTILPGEIGLLLWWSISLLAPFAELSLSFVGALSLSSVSSPIGPFPSVWKVWPCAELWSPCMVSSNSAMDRIFLKINKRSENTRQNSCQLKTLTMSGILVLVSGRSVGQVLVTRVMKYWNENIDSNTVTTNPKRHFVCKTKHKEQTCRPRLGQGRHWRRRKSGNLRTRDNPISWNKFHFKNQGDKWKFQFPSQKTKPASLTCGNGMVGGPWEHGNSHQIKVRHRPNTPAHRNWKS